MGQFVYVVEARLVVVGEMRILPLEALGHVQGGVEPHPEYFRGHAGRPQPRAAAATTR